jgi:hypothetical protein
LFRRPKLTLICSAVGGREGGRTEGRKGREGRERKGGEGRKEGRKEGREGKEGRKEGRKANFVQLLCFWTLSIVRFLF